MPRAGRFSSWLREGSGSSHTGLESGGLIGIHRRSYSGTFLKGSPMNVSSSGHSWRDSGKREPRWYQAANLCVALFVLLVMFVAGGNILQGKHSGTLYKAYNPNSIAKRIEFGLDGLKMFPVHRGQNAEQWGNEEELGQIDGLRHLQIPPVVHFIYSDSDIMKERENLYKKLQKENAGWEIRTYNMDLADTHVKAWFPTFLDSFEALNNEHEKKNVFRYLLVLKFGGIACCGLDDVLPQSLNFSSMLRAQDRFVTVWNPAYNSASAALNSCRVRQRGIRHDFIAAVAKHPILRDVYNRISSMKDKVYSRIHSLNTLERTGEGVLTDTVLSYALHGYHSKEIRVLPTKTFGTHSESKCKAPWESLHGDHGSAKGEKEDESSRQNNVAYSAQLEISEWFSRNDHDEDIVAETVALLEKVAQREAQYTLVPVSSVFDPPFDVMTHPAGIGEWHAGSDVSAAILSYGTWQPSVKPDRTPSLVDLILGSMNSKKNQGVLVDVGAGYGLASLAAASRGHKVLAFEVGSKSLEAFKESISRNLFGDMISLHDFPLGSAAQEGESVCLRVSESDETLDSDMERMQQRGYGLPSRSDGSMENCLISTTRRAGHLVSGNDRISALKVSADGWGGHVIDGFLPLLKPTRDRPKFISIEWNPGMYKKSGYPEPLKVLEELYSLGYQGISHSGYICDQRWHTLTYNMNKRNDFDASNSHAVHQPTWCRLEHDDFHVLLQIGELSKTIETILFIDMNAPL